MLKPPRSIIAGSNGLPSEQSDARARPFLQEGLDLASLAECVYGFVGTGGEITKPGGQANPPHRYPKGDKRPMDFYREVRLGNDL